MTRATTEAVMVPRADLKAAAKALSGKPEGDALWDALVYAPAPPMGEADELTERLTTVAYATEFLDVRKDILALIERDRIRWLDNIAVCDLLAGARSQRDSRQSGHPVAWRYEHPDRGGWAYTDDADAARSNRGQPLYALAQPGSDGVGELWAVGSWLSSALDDPNVCPEMKADINEWFDGNGHIRATTPAIREGGGND